MGILYKSALAILFANEYILIFTKHWTELICILRENPLVKTKVPT